MPRLAAGRRAAICHFGHGNSGVAIIAINPQFFPSFCRIFEPGADTSRKGRVPLGTRFLYFP